MTDVLECQKNKYLGSAPEKITYLSKTTNQKHLQEKHGKCLLFYFSINTFLVLCCMCFKIKCV